MNGEAASTHRRPAGFWRRMRMVSSVLHRALRMARAFQEQVALFGQLHAAVRVSSEVASLSSSRDSARLTPDVVCPRCRAAQRAAIDDGDEGL
jgi:hypothetical protein